MPFIWKGKFSGLSDSKFSGTEDSFYACVGVDGNSVPGILKVHQKLSKESGATVTALCKVSIAVSSGESFWFSATDGKIWRRSSPGTWLLVYTTTAAAGEHGCLGAIEHDGFIYWATQSRLHRIAITAIATAANWTANASEDWATFGVTDSLWHPMRKQGVSLYIGDGNQVAKVTGDTGSHAFTADALDLKAPYRIKCMEVFDIDLVIGTYIDDNVNKTEVLRWDTVSTSWTSSDTIDENGINAFIRDDNYLYVNAGKIGRIYYYDGSQLIPDKRIPGNWEGTNTGEIHPNAVATFMTIPVFGLSNLSGDPALEGVYGFGSYSKNYTKVMDLSYPVSCGLTGTIIGSILVVGKTLLVSWNNASTYGVDTIDWSNKYPLAYIETPILTPVAKRSILKSVLKIIANHAKIIPASCGLTFAYKRKYDTAYSATITPVIDTKLVQEEATETINEVAALQLKISFTVNSNDAPEIESLEYEEGEL